MHFEVLRLDRRFHRWQQPGMVDGAKGLQPAGCLRDQGIAAGYLRCGQQFFQELAGHFRHITGDQNVPIGNPKAQSGMQPAHRPVPCDLIGNHWKAKFSIQLDGSNQGNIPGRKENLPRDRFNQSGPFPRQKRFVLAHAGALSSGQHEPRLVAPHEKMVAIAANTLTHQSADKKMYICFITALAMMLAASPWNKLSAAGNVPATDSASQNTFSQRALVVRADRRTGKLVRSVAPVKASPGAPAVPAPNISEIVEKAAHENNVDPLLVHSIIRVESNYNPYALSPKGAQGLMQLMPPTARDLGVIDSFDPRQNIEAGVRYLKFLQDLYKDDRLALAAYNAGPGAVQKYKWIPPYPETQNYVNRVGQQYGAAKKAAAQHLAEPVAPPVGVMEEQHPKLEPFVDGEGRLHLRTTQQ